MRTLFTLYTRALADRAVVDSRDRGRRARYGRRRDNHGGHCIIQSAAEVWRPRWFFASTEILSVGAGAGRCVALRRRPRYPVPPSTCREVWTCRRRMDTAGRRAFIGLCQLSARRAGGRRLLGPCPHAARQLPLITDRWLAGTEESETPRADSKCGRRAACVGSRGADF